MPELRMSEEPICDFCSTPKPTVELRCEDFHMDGPHPEAGLPEYRSRGAWMACSACGAFIKAGKWEELVERGTRALAPKYKGILPERILREQVRRSHELFRQHYKP